MLAVTLPDPVKEPFGWEQRVKAVLLVELTAIPDYFAKDYIVKTVFRTSKDTGAFGDLEAVIALLPQAVTDYKKIEEDTAENKAKIIAYAKERGLNDTQIERILHLTAPHQYNQIARYLEAVDKEAEAMRASSGTIPNYAGAAAVQTEFNNSEAKRKAAVLAEGKAEADAILGKKREPRPVKELINPNNWTRKQAKLNRFYRDIGVSFGKYHVPPNKKSWCVHTALGVKSIHETALTPLDAGIKVKAFVEREFGPKDAPVVPATPAPLKLRWLALSLKGKSAQNSAFRQFKQELQKTKTVVYIQDDEKLALGGLELGVYVKQHGIAKACAAFDTYLSNLKEGSKPTVTNQDATEATDAKTYIADYMKTTMTMGGIALGDIHKELNRPYHDSAMFDIPPDRRQKKGAQGVKPGPVRNRVNQLFGMETVGWRFTYHPNTMVHYGEEEREKYDEKTKQTKATTWYVVRLEMFIFEYRVVRSDGSEEWLAGSPLSDIHANIGRQAAYHGAISSLLKQAVRSMGGFDFLDSTPSERPRQDTSDKPREQQSTEPARQDTPAASDKSGSAGLNSADVQALMKFADAEKIPRSTIIVSLGIQNWSQWTTGLEAAKLKLKGAVPA